MGNTDQGGRMPTQADGGWRGAGNEEVNGNSSGRQATQADSGWRREASGAGNTAAGNEAGKNANSSGRQATQADSGWRSSDPQMQTMESIMQGASANAVINKEDFLKSAENLTELITSNNNAYVIQSLLSKEGGEALVYLCTAPSGETMVAKLYYGVMNSGGVASQARKAVLEYMHTEEGRKYTIPVEEIGLVSMGGYRYYFEIMPYCTEGDLYDLGLLTFQEIVKVVEQLVEAIHSVHSAGILHRDIKPENIYRHQGRVLLGDFGVATLAQNGVSNATRSLLATDGYAAPELRLGLTNSPVFIYDEKTDYYSLGITIASLFEGHFVYKGMDDSVMLMSVRNGRIPLIRQDANRSQLENLINGLCCFDSKKRFGYEEVQEWLKNHNFMGNVSEDDEGWKEFRILNDTCNDEKSMFETISKDREHWAEGIQLLYSKALENYFTTYVPFRSDLARAARVADENYRGTNKDMGLAYFLKALYPPGPIVWQGITFQGLSVLGYKMMTTQKPKGYATILKCKAISYWLDNTEGIEVDKQTRSLVGRMENYAEKEPDIACFWFGFSFAKKRELKIGEKNVSTLPEFFHVVFDDPYEFYHDDILNSIIDPRNAGARIYGFLFSFGYDQVIGKYWKEIDWKSRYNISCLTISMFDDIASQVKADTAPIRKFFYEYGPVGGYIYAQRLARETDEQVYRSLDSKGAQVLKEIKEVKLDPNQPVQKIYADHLILAEKVERMRDMMTDNPFCLETGVYEQKGIVCTNLKGCFAFRLYEKMMPLGFEAYILAAKQAGK